jgi:hypothetical protein
MLFFHLTVNLLLQGVVELALVPETAQAITDQQPLYRSPDEQNHRRYPGLNRSASSGENQCERQAHQKRQQCAWQIKQENDFQLCRFVIPMKCTSGYEAYTGGSCNIKRPIASQFNRLLSSKAVNDEAEMNEC